MSRYPIPGETVRVEIRAGNSRFIATLARADSVAEAREFIRTIREEMPDATHHVYAMKIGFGASITEGMSDDGEPSGTSGPPVLAVLRGANVGDAVIVVTRYFGGTKLGTGGLVSAYGDAAKAAIAAMCTIEKVDRERLSIAVPYTWHDRIRQLAEEVGALIDKEQFGAAVDMTLSVPVDAIPEFRDRLRELTGGKVEAEEEGGSF